MKTLENVQQVCNRWNFLANTPELWIFKCKKLGENENLGQIEAFLINELTNDEDIDWKLAYMELLEFIDLLKKNYFDKFSESNKLSELNSRISDDLASKREISFARSTRGGMYLNYISYLRINF